MVVRHDQIQKSGSSNIVGRIRALVLVIVPTICVVDEVMRMVVVGSGLFYRQRIFRQL